MTATTRKGALRAKLYAELRARADRGDFHLTTGRAADFFGPEAVFGAIFSTRSYERLAAGKPVEVMGDPDRIHSYSYIPDVARGLAILGTEPTPDGGIFHLPVSWQGTTRELLDLVARELGHPQTKIRQLPSWFLRAAGTFVPLLAAVAEMTYQWESDYILDDARFRETFGAAATSPNDAVRETVAWVRGSLLEAA
jgi:nucleoside-diphosphate-sugar epimerase